MSTIHNDRHADSYYAASANTTVVRPPLQDALSCDVCVVGAGITGLTAALHLAEQGYDVVVVEAHQVGWGASGRSGGQAIIGFNKGVRELQKLVGHDDARKLWDMNVESLDLLKGIVAKNAIQ